MSCTCLPLVCCNNMLPYLAGTETNFEKSFFSAKSGKLHDMVHVSEPLRLQGVSSLKLVCSLRCFINGWTRVVLGFAIFVTPLCVLSIGFACLPPLLVLVLCLTLVCRTLPKVERLSCELPSPMCFGGVRPGVVLLRQLVRLLRLATCCIRVKLGFGKLSLSLAGC